MKTKLKTLSENEQKTKIQELLKNNNFRNNQNYVMWDIIQEKIFYFIFNKKTSLTLWFDIYKNTQEISLNIINDLNKLKLILTIPFYFYLLYFIYDFSFLIFSKYQIIIFIILATFLFLFLFKSFLLKFLVNFSFYIKYLNKIKRKYLILLNWNKAIIYNKNKK